MEMTQFKKTFLATLVALSASSATLYSAAVSAHGYVSQPASRAVNCQKGLNKNCGQVTYEPQSVEAPKTASDFPPDGKIASGGWYGAATFDNERSDWQRINIKPGWQQIKWYLTAPHATTNFKYYITKPGWSNANNATLTRSMFEDTPFCQEDMAGVTPPNNVTHECNVPERTGNQLIYAVWRINNTGNSFYQIIDVKFDGSNDNGSEEAAKPVADIKISSDRLSTGNLMLDASASSGESLRYSWQVITNSDKVILTGNTGSKASIRLKQEATSNFDVQVKLTVTNAKEISASKTVTLKAIKAADVNAPVAVVPANFTVEEQDVSAGYTLDGSNSKNAKSVQWKSLTKGFWLQEAAGKPWTATLSKPTVRALIPANTTGNAVYQLTVTGADGTRDVKTVTLTVKAKSSGEDKPEIPATGEYPAWQSAATYVAGDKVTYQGVRYIAAYWTRSAPGSDGSWKLADSSQVAAWSASTPYNGGDHVTYQGKKYKAAYWTRGDIPGQHAVWIAE